MKVCISILFVYICGGYYLIHMQRNHNLSSGENAFTSSELSDSPFSKEDTLFNIMETKDIPFNSKYFATSDGNIFSKRYRNTHTCRELKQHNERTGYLKVCITNKCKSKHYLVHRLIGLTFIPNPKKLPQINHINFNKKDNRAENLEWTDQSYNIQHAHDNGRVDTAKGERHPCHKLTDIQVREIRELYRLRKYTQVQLCEIFGITIGPMNQLLNRKLWKHI